MFLLLAFRECAADDVLSLMHDGIQVVLALEALSVNLAEIFGSRRPRCEPTVGRDDFQPADRLKDENTLVACDPSGVLLHR